MLTGFATRILGVAGVLATAFVWGCSHGEAKINRKWTAERNVMVAEQARIERELNEGNNRVTAAYIAQRDAQKLSAAAARTELAGLHADIADRAASAAASGRFDEAAEVGKLLGACEGRYTAVAEDADGLAAQVRGLQDYAQRVCGAR